MKRKIVFLIFFIVGIILTFNVTNIMLNNGFDVNIGKMQAADSRTALSLISLFGLIGYFVEVILERLIAKKTKDENS